MIFAFIFLRNNFHFKCCFKHHHQHPHKQHHHYLPPPPNTTTNIPTNHTTTTPPNTTTNTPTNNTTKPTQKPIARLASKPSSTPKLGTTVRVLFVQWGRIRRMKSGLLIGNMAFCNVTFSWLKGSMVFLNFFNFFN